MRDFAPLPRRLFAAAADVVAPRLLGHWLIRRTPEGVVGGVITEVEAYLCDDPASHSCGGRTQRNHAMFGPPGHAYVYLIYGMHHCVNAVCQPAGVGEAVLIRSLAPAFGAETMMAARRVENPRHLANGPGKLCAALRINRELDGIDLCKAGSPLLLARNPGAANLCRTHGPPQAGPRIGITKAAERPLRFILPGSPFLSRPPARG